MGLNQVLERENSAPLKIYVVGFSPKKGRLDRPPKNVDLAFVDSSYFDFSMTDRNIHDLEAAFSGSMVFLDGIVDEINDAPHAGRINPRFRRAIDAMIAEETTLAVKEALNNGEVKNTADILQSLEGALAKRIAYNDFIENFNAFYTLAERLAREELPEHIGYKPWRIRKDDVKRPISRVWREGNKQLSESRASAYHTLRKDPTRLKGDIYRKLLSLVYYDLLAKLPEKVYDAISKANDSNGHVTTFSDLTRQTSIDHAPWVFRTYWMNAYLGCINLMLRRTIHYAIDEYSEDDALREIRSRFESNVENDTQLVATATHFRVNGKNRVIVSNDHDIKQCLLLLGMTSPKTKPYREHGNQGIIEQY